MAVAERLHRPRVTLAAHRIRRPRSPVVRQRLRAPGPSSAFISSAVSIPSRVIIRSVNPKTPTIAHDTRLAQDSHSCRRLLDFAFDRRLATRQHVARVERGDQNQRHEITRARQPGCPKEPELAARLGLSLDAGGHSIRPTAEPRYPSDHVRPRISTERPASVIRDTPSCGNSESRRALGRNVMTNACNMSVKSVR